MSLAARLLNCLAAGLLLSAAGGLSARDTPPLQIGVATLPADGPGMLEIAAGSFNAFRRQNASGGSASAVVNLEYRFGRKLYYPGPLLGALVNTDGGKFVSGGAYADIRIRGYLLTPAVAVGAYEQGSGPDPGGTLQFRLSVTPACELKNGTRVGLRAAHISNAGLHRDNPGEKELLLVYGVRFGGGPAVRFSGAERPGASRAHSHYSYAPA